MKARDRPFAPVRAILRKRAGKAHPPGEIEAMIDGFVSGGVADYQMTAWMMAVLFRGMSREETARLTTAMIRTGRPLPDWGAGGPVVDKHSTGGIGDKVSLVVAPIAAACGMRVPMISGRCLGHTGGTLDKLESIPGYQVDISTDRFREIVRTVGVSIAGAGGALAPADRKMYALRDVSGTVESAPLIVSSILAKKASARLEGLVLDVKVGSGGFLPRRSDARRLARMLVEASADLGVRAEALLTWMGDPLGRTIGNALEVAEAVRLLRGEPSDPRLRDLCIEVASAMARVGGNTDREKVDRLVRRALDGGAALDRFARMIEAHGGDRRVAEDPGRLPVAPVVRTVHADRDGWIRRIGARGLGRLVVDLGGGRRRAGESLDPRVGIVLLRAAGDPVRRGDAILELHLAEEGRADWAAGVASAQVDLSPRRPRLSAVLLERIPAEASRGSNPR